MSDQGLIIRDRWESYRNEFMRQHDRVDIGERYGAEVSYRFHEFCSAVYDPVTNPVPMVHYMIEPVASVTNDGVSKTLRFLFATANGPVWFDITSDQAYDLWECMHLSLVDFLGWDPTNLDGAE